MRRWLALIMIALLPLRALAGDLMAIQMSAGMAMQQAAVAATPQAGTDAVSGAPATPASMHEDCHGHESAGGAAEPAAASGAAQAAAGCEGSCLVCQMCHSAVIISAGEPGNPVMAAVDAPAQSVAHYSSASIERGHKPPIS